MGRVRKVGNEGHNGCQWVHLWIVCEVFMVGSNACTRYLRSSFAPASTTSYRGPNLEAIDPSPHPLAGPRPPQPCPTTVIRLANNERQPAFDCFLVLTTPAPLELQTWSS